MLRPVALAATLCVLIGGGILYSEDYCRTCILDYHTTSISLDMPVCPVLWRVPIRDNMEFNADTGDVNGDGLDDVAIVPDDVNEGDQANGQADVNTLQVIGSNGEELWSKDLLLDKGIVGVADINNDTFAEVVITGTTADRFKIGNVHVFDKDGSQIWETEILSITDYYPVYPISIVFVDSNSDSRIELVLPPGGNPAEQGQPMQLIDNDGNVLRQYWGGLFSYSTLANVTEDEEEELLTFEMFKRIESYSTDLTANLNGKEIDWDGLDWYNHLGAIGDLDNDSYDDIISVVQDGSGGSYVNGLIAVRNIGWFDFGPVYWKKEFSKTREDMPGMPLLKDINGDGKLDVLLGADRKIYAFSYDGTQLWTLGNESFFTHSPDILSFDIDEDNHEEILFENEDTIYEVLQDGTYLPICTFAYESRLLIRKSEGLNKGLLVSGDIDGDGFAELVIEERTPTGYHVAVLSKRIEHIEAIVDCDPDTLNSRSRGKWVTCYIELPGEYDPRSIDATKILLLGSLVPELDPKYGFVKSEDSYIADHDGNGVLERMVKFSRTEVIGLLSPGVAVILNLTGELSDGTKFKGGDVIRVIDL